MASIARRYGLHSWRTLHEASENAELRERRADPFVLHPGDVVAIPDREVREATIATTQRHRFVVERPKTVLRVRLHDDEGTAYADRPYKLFAGGAEYEGRTAGDGLIAEVVPAHTERAKVQLWIEGDPPEFEPVVLHLNVGHLDPVDQLTGAQSRLHNLGFYFGALTGELDEATREAIEAFQARHGLTVNGELDDATRDALDERAHRS